MFGRSLKYGVATILGLGILLFWLLLLPITDLRDWIASAQWPATRSTSLFIQPKSSQVRYTYVVDNHTYSGRRTHFFVTSLYQDQRHLDWLNANRNAESVTVYYDPDAPQRAVLVREVGAELGVRWIITGVVSAAMCLTPMLFFGGVWWWLRRQFPR